MSIKGPEVIGRVFNVFKSPPDERDYKPVAGLGAKIEYPKDHSTVSPKHKVRNQGAYGACVGYGITDAITASLGAYDDRWFGEPLSPMFVWLAAKETDSIQLPSGLAGQDGTYIRAGLKAVRKWGNLYERFAPLGMITYYSSSRMYEDAAWLKAAAYYSIGISDYIKHLASGKQIVIGINVLSSFLQAQKTLTKEDLAGGSLGGHCCRVVGYRTTGTEETVYTIGNSWGEQWGVEGYIDVTESYLKGILFESYFLDVPAINYFA